MLGECPICFEYVSLIKLKHIKNIKGNLENHVVCTNCFKRINNVCPICRYKINKRISTSNYNFINLINLIMSIIQIINVPFIEYCILLLLYMDMNYIAIILQLYLLINIRARINRLNIISITLLCNIIRDLLININWNKLLFLFYIVLMITYKFIIIYK